MQIQIDPDMTVTDLIRWWKTGEKVRVLDILAKDHAALTALMLVQGAADGDLRPGDTFTIANLLGDRRKKACDEQEARRWPLPEELAQTVADHVSTMGYTDRAAFVEALKQRICTECGSDAGRSCFCRRDD